MTFLLAGHETVNISIGWALHLLSKNPHDQDLLREELVKAFPDKSKFSPTLDEINSLEYLNCVVKETLRLNSPSIIYIYIFFLKKKIIIIIINYHINSLFFTFTSISRNNIEDKFFGDYFIPKVYLSYLLFFLF